MEKISNDTSGAQDDMEVGMFVVIRSFVEHEEKPWEVSVRKGQVLKLLESKQKDWWKVQVDDQQGYVPANCLRRLESVSSVALPQENHSQTEQYQTLTKPNRIELQLSSSMASLAVAEMTPLGTTICEAERNIPVARRKSARIEAVQAKKPKVISNKGQHEDITWKAALNRYLQKKKSGTDNFQLANKSGQLISGPRDLIKTPGLNKVSVFPDVKLEKIEPPEEETETVPTSPQYSETEYELIPLETSAQPSVLDVDLTFVKEEVDLGEYPSEAYPNRKQSDMLEECDEHDSQPLQDQSETELKTEISSFTEQLSLFPVDEHQVRISPSFVADITMASSTSSEWLPVEAASLENSLNLCCVLFSKVWDIFGIMYDPVPTPKATQPATTTVLNLRLVCKSWCEVINNYYDNLAEYMYHKSFQTRLDLHWNRQYFNGDYNETRTEAFIPSVCQYYNFDSCSKIRKFLQHFQNTHSVRGPLAVQRNKNKNPLIGRYLSVSTEHLCFQANMELSHEFTTSVTELVSKYGNHVWYCKICIDEEYNTVHRSFNIKVVTDLLRLMPNLKHLAWNNICTENKGLSSYVECLEQDVLDLLHKPKLAHLKRVDLGTLENVVQETFTNHRDQITAISLQMCSNERFNLPNLTEVNLQIYTQKAFESFRSEGFRQNWPLRTIHISLCFPLKLVRGWEQTDQNETDTRTVTISSVFLTLERWKQTLKHVTINLPSNCVEIIGQRQLPDQLDLPNVCHLIIGFGHYAVSSDLCLDFISPMRHSLEWLELKYSTEPDNLKRLLYFCEDVLSYPTISWVLPSSKQIPLLNDYDSNIWNVFPKLNRMHYARLCMKINRKLAHVVESYTREGWIGYRYLNQQVVRPIIKIVIGDCSCDFKLLHVYYTADRMKKLVLEEMESEVDPLLLACRRIRQTTLRSFTEAEIKTEFFKELYDWSTKRIYPNFLAYMCANYVANNCDRGYFCGLCPGKRYWYTLMTIKNHFNWNHYLYAAAYKCDFAGCKEKFDNKYDVVGHRVSHGKKFSKVYYELEAEPLHRLSSPEMQHVFKWIHFYPSENFSYEKMCAEHRIKQSQRMPVFRI